jgi:hypothetical protein
MDQLIGAFLIGAGYLVAFFGGCQAAECKSWWSEKLCFATAVAVAWGLIMLGCCSIAGK